MLVVLKADRDNPLEEIHNVRGIITPVVRVINDARRFVRRNLVVLHNPLDGGHPVHKVLVCFQRDASQGELAVVDDTQCRSVSLPVLREPHLRDMVIVLDR